MPQYFQETETSKVVRVHPYTCANYLIYSSLVSAYCITVAVDIDFEKTPLGKDRKSKDDFFSLI